MSLFPSLPVVELPLHRPHLADQGDARERINLEWLIRLRWGAVIGQSITVAAVSTFLHIPLPLPPLLAVLMLTAGSNLLLTQWGTQARRLSETVIGLVVTLDIVLLTALLYYTGGSTNPFNFLYLVHIALAAVTLQAAWIAGLLCLAFCCFGSLFWWHVPLSLGNMATVSVRLHGQGMAVAFVLAAAFIVYFVHRVTRALTYLETELAQTREASARTERLSSLATLAAGAAHELATPLATIAIVAKELERHLAQLPSESTAAPGLIKVTSMEDLREDARLIRHEVERCRGVLTHMAADAGASAGEAVSALEAAVLIDMVLADLPQARRVAVRWAPLAKGAILRIPGRSVAQAIRCVLKNALEASGRGEEMVQLRLALESNRFVIEVEDAGSGMRPEVLAHVGEPFFTTKAPGLGMGLGLFLTRTVFEGLGGNLCLQSIADQGTTATLRLPFELETNA